MSVVVAYSPTEQGRAALRAALHEAGHRRTALVVASHGHLDSGGGRSAAGEDEVLREIAETPVPGTGHPEVRIRSCAERDVGDFLLDVAGEEDAGLLVIGLRGKSRIGKLNLGAAARKVVLASPCPVLAVKDRPRTGTAPASARE